MLKSGEAKIKHQYLGGTFVLVLNNNIAGYNGIDYMAKYVFTLCFASFYLISSHFFGLLPEHSS